MSTAELYAAVEANPSDVRAFEALIKHLVAEGDEATLEQVYRQVPDWAPDAQSPLLRVLNQQARVNKEAAIGSFLQYQNGLMLWQRYDEPQKAEMSFRKVTSAPEDPTLLRKFYLEYYTAQNNWRRLEQFLSDPAKGGLDDPIEVKRVLAQRAEEHGQPDKAISFWQGVRSADPCDDKAEAKLRELYVTVGKWHALVDLLKDRVKRLDDGAVDEKISLLQEMIGVYKSRMNAASKVVATWHEILNIAPGDPTALDALAEEYTELKRWPDLVKVLNQKVEHEADPTRLIQLHRKIASIMLDRFSNTTEAIKHYEAILGLDPANAEAIRVLKEIYETRRDWDSYIGISEREIKRLPDGDDRHERFVELARLASERIRKPQTPIALWERVLEADDSHAEALSELETLYERDKNYRSLASVLDKRVALAADVADQIALLDKLGMVASVRLHDPDRSAQVWRQLLERDPSHRKAQAELKKKYIAERDWDNLEWFFRSYGDVTDWVRTLESQAKSIADPADKTELLFKAAAVWKDELGEQRRAVKNLEAVLDLAPDHAGAARLLIPIYRELANFKALPGVYDIVLEDSSDAGERREVLLAQAEVQEHHLGAPDAAFFAYVQAVSEAPDAVDLHPELKRLAEISQNWEAYVYVLQESVDQIEAEADKIVVLLEIGRIYRDHLGSGAEALTFFDRVLTFDEYNRDALAAAEQAHAGTDAFDQLILIRTKQLAIADSADERKAILFRLAHTWRAAVGANDEAEAIFREMLADFPRDTQVHDELVAIYLEEERYEPLLDVLDKKRKVLTDLGASTVILADLESELGMLAYGTRATGQGCEAVVDHYEAALGYDPDHAASVERLEELLADEDQRDRITRLLEPVYDARGDWAKLAQVLEIQLQRAEADGDSHTQVGLLRRLAELYKQRLTDEDLAWRSYGRLLRLQPEDGVVREQFRLLTTALSRWQQLVDLYTEHADEPLDKGSRLDIKLEVARTWHKRLSSLEEARVFYHKVLDEEPEHKEALNALEGIYVDLDRAEDLLGIYRRKIELTDDTEQKIDYLFRTSDLLRDRLEQPEDAIAAAREALDLVPGHLPAIQRLDELYTVTEQWHELARTLEETLELVAEDTERVVLLKIRLAGVHERYLDDAHRAIEIYASVFALDPDNLPTVEALERLFEDESLAPTIAPILQPYYDGKGDWKRLIDVFVVREADADLTAEKVDWHYKIAELYELLGEMPDSAFHHYEEAAALAPGSERTLGELLRLAELLDNHGELILFLQQVVDDIVDDERRVETHRTIAVLARDKTHDLEGAERQLRAILEIAPADMAATDALIALYRQSDKPADLVEMLLHKAPMQAVADADRFDLYAEAGEISASVLDDADKSIEIYETLHGLAPDQARALDALEGLYERVESWDDLVRVYEERIERAEDIETRKYYAALKGNVQADALSSADDAIDTWHRVLSWDPSDGDALAQLDLLYTKQGDWFNLQDILRRTQSLVDDEGWQQAQFRIARLYESDDQLADITQAIDAYGALLERNPKHEGAITALKTILAERDAYERAFEVLRPVLDGGGAYEDLWQQYEVLAGHQKDDPLRRVQTLHAMAALAERRLLDPGRALDAQSRAFAIEPRDAATVAELERIAEAEGFWEELVDIYSTGADEADDDYLALELRLKTGAILMDRVDAAERAIATYGQVRQDFPDHKEALARLHRLYESQGMASELAGVLRTQADTAVDDAERIEHLTSLANTSERLLGDANAAYEAYIEILDLERHSPLAVTELRRLFEAGVNPLDIAERLEPIYREQKAWDELDTLMQLKLDALTDPVDRMQLMRDLAQLALEQKIQPAEALVWYGRAFRLDPDDDGLLAQLRELATHTERWDELQRVLMGAAEAAEEQERRITLWHAAAETSNDKLGDPAEAELIYRLILDAEQSNYKALAELDKLLTAQQRWQDLEPVLVQQTEVDDIFDDERVRLLTRLAELYRDRLGDRGKAIAAWRAVLELNDMHEPSLKALQAMYTDDERWSDLFEVLQQLYDIAREDADRVTFASDMAAIAETALEQPAKAIELWEDVLAISPNDYEAVHELQRLLEGQERWQGLAEAYDRELRMGIDDSARRLELHKATGRLWMSRLDDPFQAQVCWQRAREEDPADKEALDALRAIHEEAGNEEALAETIEASLVSDHYAPQEQLALWRQLAELRTEVFADSPKGIDAWRAVLELAPGDPTAIDSLEQLYESEARWTDLVELYRTKLEHISDKQERLATWVQLGGIQQDNLSDVEAAAETYRDILAQEPSHLEASRRLEAIYEGTEQWALLAPHLLDQNEHLEEPEDRLMNLQRLARIYEERLDERDSAFLVLQRANEEVPDDPTVLSELERLAHEVGLWQELYEVYEATLPHLSGDAALDVMLKSARVQRDEIGDAEAAITLYERVLEEQEDSETALRALVDLNEGQERWSALVGVLAGLSDVTPDYGEKVTLLKRMAAVFEDKLGALDKAVDAWHQVLDVDEMDRAALTALERLQIEREDWPALIDIYERIATLEPDREGGLKLKIAGIMELHLDQVDAAIEVYEEVLTYEPSNTVALERLEALYGDREDWGKLVDVYERGFDAAQTDEERVQMARNIALLQDAVFEDPSSAAESFQRILTITPDDDEAFEALVRIYRDGERWEDLIGLHEGRYETADASDDRANALGAMAAVYRDKLDDVDNAIAMFERVLLERRTDQVALDALDDLYRRQELWEQVLEIIERKLEVEQGADKRVDLLCAQGELAAKQLGDTYRAAASYQRVLKEQPGHLPAIEALIAIYQAEERYDKVVETLRHKLDNAASDPDRSDTHVDLAEVFAHQLGEPDKALEHLEAAAKLNPESRRALWALADYYQLQRQWTKAMPLLELLVDKLDVEADREQLFKVRKRLGLCAEQVYQTEQAIDDLERALELKEPDRELLQALARLHYKKENYEQAEGYLKQVIARYRDELPSEEFIHLYMQLGESALRLGHIDQAQHYLSQVVEHDPANDKALEQIIEVLQSHGKWAEAIGYMEQLLLLKADDLERYPIQLRIGDIYAQQLGDTNKAAIAYRAALDLGVFPKEPALKLVELSVSHEDYAEAIRHLNRLIKLEEEPKKRAQFAYTAAVLYRDQLGDPGQAIKYFNLTLDNDLSNLQAFRTIDELLTKARQWKPLEQNYRRMIQRVQKQGASWEEAPKLLFMLYKNLGEIYRSRLKRLDYAISAFELAKKQRPRDEAIREILASLYEVTEDGATKAIEHHRFLVLQRPDRFESYHRLVELFKKVGDADSAWCVAGLLQTLGQASDDELRFYSTYLSPGMSEPNRVVDQTLWMQGVMSRGEDPELGRIFELVFTGLGKFLAVKPLKAFGLKKKAKIPLEDGLLICTTTRNVSRMFGIQPPDLYRHSEATGIEILPTLPPVIRLGTDMLTGRSDKELAFYVAKQLTYFHPGHIIATMYGREALDHLYMAAASLVDPNYTLALRDDLPREEQQAIAQAVGSLKGHLDKGITPEGRQQLTAVMNSFWRRTQTPDISRWHRHVELTANHAGLLAAGDVALVGTLIKNEPVGMSKLKNSEKLKEFVHYVISDGYLKLRKQLGMAIDYSELLG
ncbi:MAG: hypothetical protein CSA66_02830 [Proteobacteria bacterium]|nr:MAG: hypothetical protein CSA66_02830 [Pseudomonadota bacterium]